MTSTRQRVYLSYARADASRIARILERLEALGVIKSSDQILSDKDLQPGHASLREGVRRQIQSASKVIIVWSPSSASSQWVNYELGLADALGKVIIPVVVRGEMQRLPSQVQGRQVVVLDEGDA